ncbi:MAG TPA: hypothetical protein VL945_00825 [Candidatus Saccharimonadales bacterium]|nr:hypothetical protein [Candidatus Saccharimonadales bacterium]
MKGYGTAKDRIRRMKHIGMAAGLALGLAFGFSTGAHAQQAGGVAPENGRIAVQLQSPTVKNATYTIDREGGITYARSTLDNGNQEVLTITKTDTGTYQVDHLVTKSFAVGKGKVSDEVVSHTLTNVTLEDLSGKLVKKNTPGETIRLVIENAVEQEPAPQ